MVSFPNRGCGNVVCHGIDIVELAEFSRLLQDQSSMFLNRSFTENELKSSGDSSVRLEKLASRFATKEAVLKALRAGWGDGIAFTDVEVVTQENGAPSITLYRKLAAAANEMGITAWLISVSHTSSIAIASVIAIRANVVA